MYSIEHIRQISNGQWWQVSNKEAPIAHLLTDSRKVIFAKSALFFALVGKNHDGHQYLLHAYRQGIRHFIISRKVKIQLPDANIIVVQDSLAALQQIAAHHRQQFDLLCIGITGSNGKTIVKELLFQVLRHHYKIVRSPKSYNSQIGVPLSLWLVKSWHELGIFEAGISQVGEMQKLAPLIDCHIGIFTNIGPAHAEGFASHIEKIEQKALLFQNCKSIIYCKDFEDIEQVLQNKLSDKTFFTWSKKGDADLRISNITKEKKHSSIKAIFQNKKISIRIPFTDEVYIENALHCWAAALYLGLSENDCALHMKDLDLVAMRLELKEGLNECTIINDSYNADLDSLQIALQHLEQDKRATLILSDILQSGRQSKDLYEDVARLIKERKLKRFIGIGKEVKALAALLPKQIATAFYDNTADFLSQWKASDFHNETILIKGARRFGFERIANRLSQKVHRTVLEINLNALSHNLHLYSRFLQPATKMMVMVKASAYGSGSVAVARLLEFNRVDYLAVAYTDEGINLRRAGIQLPIMVLNPEEDSLAQMLEYQLEPEIYSLSLLENMVKLSQVKEIGIHLKLDTGMKRLGFDEGQLKNLTSFLRKHKQIKVLSVFSHLAASDEKEHDGFSRRQINIFHLCYEHIATALGYRPLRHLLNSAGILRFPEAQMDMVRLGIGLYGIDTTGLLKNQTEIVLSLKASVSQIREVKAGESIGYSRKGKAIRDTRIAIISIGYADGLRRAAGNGAYHVRIGDKLLPTIGNICMDVCMVELSGEEDIKVGDEVIIFGDHPKVEDLADCFGTIAYEVFTGVSERVKRVYVL